MTPLIPDKLTKEEVNALPLQKFEGKIKVIQTPEKADQAIDKLIQYPYLGFDTESKPNFEKGRENPVALVQLATPDNEAYIFQIAKTGITDFMATLFENDDIMKIGLALQDDVEKLIKYKPMHLNGFVDLSKAVRRLEFPVSGARNLAAHLLGFRISKSQQLSNWERPELTEQQLNYAATDAWVCLRIYHKLIAHPEFPREIL